MTPRNNLRPILACSVTLSVLPLGCHADGRLSTPPAPPSISAAAIAASPSGDAPRTEAWDRFRAAQAVTVGFPQYPALSPDGSTLVFSWAGDLWAIPSSGGIATRLTSHPATERRSAFSPDGSLLAFESDRDGGRDLYVTPVIPGPGGLFAGAIHRVTFSDRPQTLSGFTADGESLLFASAHEPSIYRASRMYSVPVQPDESGGGVITRLTDAYGTLPRHSADGKTVIFTRGRFDFTRPAYRGSGDMDVYTVNSDTGAFTRLTTFDGIDGDAHLLPDGSAVFVSSRDGQNNLWRLAAGATEATARPDQLVQLTRFAPAAPATEDGRETIGHGVRDLTVSWDGRWAAFVVWDTLYRLDLSRPGATPEAIHVEASPDTASLDYARINLDRQATEAALSPDGKTLAVIARGEVFVRSIEEGRPTRRVTDTAGRERDLAWSPDGRVLYFASDEGGVYSIYAATVALAREDLAAPPAQAETPQPEAKPDEPQAPTPPPAEPPNTPDPTPAPQPAPAPPELEAWNAQPAAEPTPPAAQPAAAPAGEERPRRAAEARREEPKKPDHGKRWQEALRFTVEPIISGDAEERYPVPSPDGRSLLFVRTLGDLYLRDLASGEERRIFSGWNAPDVVWAADSRHIIYARQDLDFNSDIFLLDTKAEPGEEAAAPGINLTRHPDMDISPRLSHDGKVLVFLSDRAGENGRYDVYGLYLDEKLEGLPSYELAEYFKKAADAAKKRKPLDVAAAEKAKPAEPLTFDTRTSYLRVRQLVSLPGSQGNLEMTPGGDRILFTATIDGRRQFLSTDYKGEDRKTVDASAVGNVSVTLTGDKALYIKSGQATTTPPGGGRTETLGISATANIYIPDQQRQKFLEAARTLGARFYHPTLKGLDWPGLTERYMGLAMGTRTSEEFNRVVGMLFGELDGSHLGISGGGGFSASAEAVGHLGIDAEPIVVDGAPGYRITRIIAGGPADRRWSRLEVGETIVSVDGRGFGAGAADRPTMDLSRVMSGTVGREVLLELVRAGPNGNGAAARRYVLITPASSGTESAIRYEDEVAQRRELVDRLSGGRLGYLHIRGMSEPSVRDFERDLFAAGEGKEGMIIDVRDNGGGWTADILLASLTAPLHATTVPRGADPASVPRGSYPRDRRLIYAWKRPINVLINENSFSNAEIFAHAIKTIGRGTLIGTPTYGGVISTGSFTLIDGSTVRMPFRGWYLPDGRDMENNGAQPDVPVPQTPEDEAVGKDTQLEEAVKELLGRLK